MELAGTASLLSSLYHGVENVLKQSLLAAGAPLPAGAAWHRDLLQLACSHGNIPAEMRDRLAPYLAFRHFHTHACGFDLDPERLAPLVRDVHTLHGDFRRAALGFVRKLG